MKILLIVILLLVVGALLIISNNNLSMNDPEDRKIAGEKYYSWLNNTFENVKDMTGYVVGMKWMPKE